MSGGCAIQPLPQDVTPLNTYWIVAQVRCEVRNALKHSVEYALSRRDEDAHLIGELENRTTRWADLIKTVRNPILKEVLLRYAAASIGYDFSLDMTEDQNFTGGATLTRPITRGTQVIGFNVGSDHKRQNTRTFTIEDTFEGLLLGLDDELRPGEKGYDKQYCTMYYTDQPNYNYPITGQTRIADTVSTFLSLNQSGDLSKSSKAGAPKTPSLTDDMQFTTSYNGSISPGSTFTPLGRVLALTGATAKFDNTRTDIHRVTLALAMPEKVDKPLKKLQEQSRNEVHAALTIASANRSQLDLQKISNSLSSPTGASILNLLLP
ncbi:hypothetical protein [Methylobacterium sp. 1030]|uniref:hypothetical protein n=1 Tax=Methylobacterium sp. 1030 TaxID=3156404 RepID=UPI00339A33A4